MKKKTPLKHTRRHILDIFAVKKPLVCQKANFVLFAKNDNPEVYKEANFVTLNFLTPVTLYNLSPVCFNINTHLSSFSPASCLHRLWQPRTNILNSNINSKVYIFSFTSTAFICESQIPLEFHASWLP